MPLGRRAPASNLCGVGMGLDSQLLAAGRGAVVTCLAKGGPAEAGRCVCVCVLQRLAGVCVCAEAGRCKVLLE